MLGELEFVYGRTNYKGGVPDYLDVYETDDGGYKVVDNDKVTSYTCITRMVLDYPELEVIKELNDIAKEYKEADKRFDEYGHYGENNPPLPMSPVGNKVYET